MRTFHDALLQRRAALVERSSAQRGKLVATVARVRRGTVTPALLAAAALLAASPAARTWVVRGWAAYTIFRRLTGR